MKTLTKSLLTLMAIVIALGSYAQNYSKILKDAIKKSLGNDLKGYDVLDYPMDNCGLLTTYRKNAKPKNFEFDMFDYGIDKSKLTDTGALSLNGYASVQQGGGTITIDQDMQNKLGVDFILPKIFSVLGLTSKYDKTKIVNLKLTLGPVAFRLLKKANVEPFIKAKPQDSRMYQLFDSGQLVMVVADCVITKMDVEITLKDTSTLGIDAHFGWKGSTVASKILDSATVGVNVSKQVGGTYKFSLIRPVIFARIASKQPHGGSLEDADKKYFEDWLNVDADQVVNTDELEKAIEAKKKKRT
jgi:hypothetical protein